MSFISHIRYICVICLAFHSLLRLFETLAKFGHHCFLEEILTIRVIDPTNVLNLIAGEVQCQLFFFIACARIPEWTNKHRVLALSEINFLEIELEYKIIRLTFLTQVVSFCRIVDDLAVFHQNNAEDLSSVVSD